MIARAVSSIRPEKNMPDPNVYEFSFTAPSGRWLATYRRKDANSDWLLDGPPKLIEHYLDPPKLPDALQRYPDGRPVHPELTPANPETSGPVVPDGPGPAADSGGHRGFG